MNVAGGAQRVTANLVNTLCDTYEVHLIAFNKDSIESFYSLNKEVHFLGVDLKEKRIREAVFEQARFLRRYLKKNGISIVFSMGASSNLYMLAATLFSKVKAIYCEHSNLNNQLYSDKGQKWSQILGAYFADRIVTLTKRDQDAFKNKFRISKKKSQYIYNWVDNEIIMMQGDYDLEARKIITVGRFDPVKGYDMLVEAGKIVFKKYPEWSWDIYGGGEDKDIEHIKKMIEENGISKKIHLKGQISDMYDRYKKYSIYVMTSRYEGLPMVLLEAKANKLPIVSFDCETGPSEIVRNDIDGYLVESGNVEALAEKIMLLIERADIRKRFSEHSQENLGKFSKSEIMKQWYALIECMLK